MSNPNTASRFDEIYNSTSKAVLAFITVKCGCVDDISDIFQDTYMELYRVLCKRGVGYVTNEKALVLKIARRKIARYYSFREHLRAFVSTTPIDEYDETGMSGFEADAFLTEDFSVNHILLDSARQLIRSKREDIQKVFYLMYDVGLTIPEIANAMHMSETSVKNKLYRTLKELRALLTS